MVRQRVDALRTRMTDEADVFIGHAPVTVRYLTGFDGVFGDEPDALVVISRDEAWLITDSRYATAVAQADSGNEWRTVIAVGSMLEEVVAQIRRMDSARVAVEATVPHTVWSAFSRAWGAEPVAAENWVETLRAAKSDQEIARIQAAQALTDRAFDHILQRVAVGRAERDIALDLEFFMRREGSEGVAFAPIVASGPNSALPHATPTDRVLATGDFLKLDFGARVDGYCADMTRTIVIGSANDEQRSMYSAVLEANLVGIAAVRPGIQGRSVDSAARSVLVSAGYGERFTHGLGHGVGMEVHEMPGVGPRSVMDLSVGSVITIEPGVYVPGMGGVRIEDLVVVERDGARVLTASTKELIEL